MVIARSRQGKKRVARRLVLGTARPVRVRRFNTMCRRTRVHCQQPAATAEDIVAYAREGRDRGTTVFTGLSVEPSAIPSGDSLPLRVTGRVPIELVESAIR